MNTLPAVYRFHAGMYARAAVRSAVCCTAVCCAVLLCTLSVCPAQAGEYDIIIEKNLFHDQRMKWEIEEEQASSEPEPPTRPRTQPNIDQINLFGTVIADARSHAVMRTRERGRQEIKEPYAAGDFISGFQVVEVRRGSVVLRDSFDDNHYELFVNEGKVDRTAVRTEIQRAAPARAAQTGRRAPGQAQAAQRRRPPPQPAQTADFLRQRFERDLRVLRNNQSETVVRQAERNWERLRPLLPHMEDSDRQQALRLKREFDRLRGEE